jgi:hypothetical protein
VLAVAASFLLMAAWALADPLLSGPDEPAQLIHAEAIVRGQLIGRPQSAQADNPGTIERTPGFLLNSNSLAYWCFIFEPNVTAVCAPPLKGPDHLVSVPTYVGHYPPLYYVAVGWPSVLDSGPTGVLWMRLASALLNALLLGTALWLAARRSRVLVVAVLVAVTPTVIYYSASVNPNGLEMTSAVCFWCAVLGLTMSSSEVSGRIEIVIAAVSGALLASARGLSPVWVVLVLLAAVLGGDLVQARAVSRRPDARVAGGALLLVILAAVAWIVKEHGLDELGYASHSSYASLFHQTLTATPHYLAEMVGFFGANNVPAPPFATVVVVAGLALFVLVALAVGSWRERVVLALLLVAIVAVPVASGVATGHHYGLIWQGRYTVAVGVGSPIFAGYVVAAWLERRRSDERRTWAAPVALTLAGALAAGQFASFLWVLRRFMVGANGPLSGVFGGIWHPPVDGFVLLIWAALGALGLWAVALRAAAGG